MMQDLASEPGSSLEIDIVIRGSYENPLFEDGSPDKAQGVHLGPDAGGGHHDAISAYSLLDQEALLEAEVADWQGQPGNGEVQATCDEVPEANLPQAQASSEAASTMSSSAVSGIGRYSMAKMPADASNATEFVPLLSAEPQLPMYVRKRAPARPQHILSDLLAARRALKSGMAAPEPEAVHQERAPIPEVATAVPPAETTPTCPATDVMSERDQEDVATPPAHPQPPTLAPMTGNDTAAFKDAQEEPLKEAVCSNANHDELCATMCAAPAKVAAAPSKPRFRVVSWKGGMAWCALLEMMYYKLRALTRTIPMPRQVLKPGPAGHQALMALLKELEVRAATAALPGGVRATPSIARKPPPTPAVSAAVTAVTSVCGVTSAPAAKDVNVRSPAPQRKPVPKLNTAAELQEASLSWIKYTVKFPNGDLMKMMKKNGRVIIPMFNYDLLADRCILRRMQRPLPHPDMEPIAEEQDLGDEGNLPNESGQAMESIPPLVLADSNDDDSCRVDEGSGTGGDSAQVLLSRFDQVMRNLTPLTLDDSDDDDICRVDEGSGTGGDSAQVLLSRFDQVMRNLTPLTLNGSDDDDINSKPAGASSIDGDGACNGGGDGTDHDDVATPPTPVSLSGVNAPTPTAVQVLSPASEGVVLDVHVGLPAPVPKPIPQLHTAARLAAAQAMSAIFTVKHSEGPLMALMQQVNNVIVPTFNARLLADRLLKRKFKKQRRLECIPEVDDPDTLRALLSSFCHQLDSRCALNGNDDGSNECDWDSSDDEDEGGACAGGYGAGDGGDHCKADGNGEDGRHPGSTCDQLDEQPPASSSSSSSTTRTPTAASSNSSWLSTSSDGSSKASEAEDVDVEGDACYTLAAPLSTNSSSSGIVMENVPGPASKKGGRILRKLRKGLAKLLCGCVTPSVEEAAV